MSRGYCDCMSAFNIGDTVQILVDPYRLSVGTVVYLNEEDGTYLVRIGAANQHFYRSEEIELFTP